MTEFEPGTCSHCGRPAERGQSGSWWHAGPTCWNPRPGFINLDQLDAKFIPDEKDNT